MEKHQCCNQLAKDGSMCSARGSPVEMLLYPAMDGDGVPGILVYAIATAQNFELASVFHG